MLVTEFVPRVYYKATGKAATFTTGQDKWLKILAIANTYIDVWQETPGIDWRSLYDRAFSSGKVTATDEFDLDTDIRKVSLQEGDAIRILKTDGEYSEYTSVPYDQLKTFPDGNYCAFMGGKLVFNAAFTSASPEFGGTIQIPCYTYANYLVNDSDSVPVDIPNWLVFMTAAEYIRNDITRKADYPNLVAEAEEVMNRMKENNGAQNTDALTPWTPFARSW